jgi:predicted phage terminase large subunit-like protein
MPSPARTAPGLNLRAERRRLAQAKLKRELVYSGPDDVRWRDGCAALAHLIGYDVEPNHDAILTHAAAMRRRRRTLLLGFRGMGKSTVGTITLAIKGSLENHNVRELFVSSTDGAAQEFLKETRIHLQTNDDLISMFGRFFDPSGGQGVVGRFRDGYATIAQRTQLWLREPTFLSIGTGGQVAARHFDLVFGDDIVIEKNSRTANQRGMIRSWHDSSLIGALMPHSTVHYRGTRYHPGDLYDDFQNGRPGETSGVLRDCTLVLPLVENYEDPYDQWRSTSPIRHPREVCVQLRKEMGAYHFQAQMQQDTRAGEGIIFNWADFRWYSLDERPPVGDMKIFIFFDLAGRKTDVGDFFAGVVVGVWVCPAAPVYGAEPGDLRIYVLDLVRERAGTKRQKELILATTAKWKPIIAGVEAVAQQTGFADEVQSSTAMPVVPVELKGPMEGDKVARAMRVSPKVEAHQVYFPNEPDTEDGDGGLAARCRPLLTELTQFNQGDHDDCVDAFVGAITLAMYGGPGAAAPVPEDPRDYDDSGLLADYGLGGDGDSG